MKQITLRELDVLMAGSAEWALFDVREAGEADAGHLFGASFLPRRQIELRIGDLVPNRVTTIVLYDEGGPRAGAIFPADHLNRAGRTANLLPVEQAPAKNVAQINDGETFYFILRMGDDSNGIASHRQRAQRVGQVLGRPGN